MTKPKPNRRCKCGNPVAGRAFLCPECKSIGRVRLRQDGHCWCGKPSRAGLVHCEDCTRRLRDWQNARKHSQAVKASNLKQRCKAYGLTVDQHAALLEAQRGVCAICGNPETETKYGTLQSLSIDHDHATGAVRGLLCGRCNKAIGFMLDDSGRLRLAAKYLEMAR